MPARGRRRVVSAATGQSFREAGWVERSALEPGGRTTGVTLTVSSA